MEEKYEYPTPEEVRVPDELAGKRITIYWKGDNVFYPCLVKKYDAKKERHIVLYENDETGKEYLENLRKSEWKIWRGTDQEYVEYISQQYGGTPVVSISKPAEVAPAGVKKTKIPSYTAMIMEAVTELNDKEGSSIMAIRKFIQMNYDIRTQQASFNNLTLKAANKLVATNELEKIKHSFRISAQEKERRKRAEKENKLKEKLAAGLAISDRKLSSFGIDPATYASILAHNKVLRKELVDLRSRRDAFLLGRLPLIKPFLPTNDYFTKKPEERDAHGMLIGGLGTRSEVRKKNPKKPKAIVPRTTSTRRTAATVQFEFGSADDSKMEIVNDQDTNPNQEAEGNDENGEVEASQEQQEEDSMEVDDAAGANLDQSMIDSEQPEGNGEENDNEDNEEEDDEGDDAEDDQSEEGEEGDLNVSNVEDVTGENPSNEGEDNQNENSPLDIDAVEPDPVDEEPIMPYSTLDGVEMIAPPKMLTADLHPHQVVGISWLVHMYKNGMPMILGDQMGLGKTLQTIGFLAYLYETMKNKGPHLIVVPLSVLSNWISEIERFCPTFRTIRFHGPKIERDRIKEEEMRDLSEFEIVVTTFEILVSEINYFRRRYVWSTVIIDEGHRLKNEKSQLSEKLRLVPCIGKVVLTGTPLQNNLHELWALLYYLAPDNFTTPEPFDEGFDLHKGKINNTTLRKARRMLSVFMLRRIKDQVALSLPSKKEVTLLVSLTGQQIELYRQLLCGLDHSTIEIVMREGSNNSSGNSNSISRAASNANLASSSLAEAANPSTASASSSSALVASNTSSNANNTTNTNDSEWRRLMNILLQLRKICNHTYLLPHIAPDPYEVTEEIVTGSGKLEMLDRILPILKEDGHRVLLFSQFTSMLDILEDYCELRDFSYVRLDGETNRVKRRLDVRRFNAPNSNLFIFLISTRAGGLGLNLASADTVILYDSDWNPQVDLQAMERAHRIGQRKPVRVFRLVCRGSVEERMISRAEKKLFLNAMVAEVDPDATLSEHQEEKSAVTGGEEIMEALGVGGSGAAMSKAELASLIRFGANAIFESDKAAGSGGNVNHISDEDLSRLLERQGRDKPYPGEETAATTSVENAPVSTPAEVTTATDPISDADAFEKAQQLLKERMEKLQEIDLRQLGNEVFTKKRTNSGRGRPSKQFTNLSEEDNNNVLSAGESGLDTSLILDTKRNRKERIVLVDGKGTGYGGAVPVLAENMSTAAKNEGSDNEEESGGIGGTRGRQWSHRAFCTLCGRKEAKCPTHTVPVGVKMSKAAIAAAAAAAAAANAPDSKENSFTKCAHCPFIFHNRCIAATHLPDYLSNSNNTSSTNLAGLGNSNSGSSSGGPGGMFICPHHRCVLCNRSTASAGGLLFRCLGCFTSYCEDCLPQDEIESMGRCKELEIFGYHSRQAYYIKCPSCCAIEGVKATGVLGDQNQEGSSQNNEVDEAEGRTDAGEAEKDETAEGSDGNAIPTEESEPVSVIKQLRTQAMRIVWKEVLPTPPPSPKKKKQSKKAAKKAEKKAAKTPTKTPSKSSSSGSKTPLSGRKRGRDIESEVEEDDEDNQNEASGSEDDSDEEDEDDVRPKKQAKRASDIDESSPFAKLKYLEDSRNLMNKRVPQQCSLDKALELILTNDYFSEIKNILSQTVAIHNADNSMNKGKPIDIDFEDLTGEFALIYTKISSGRYRSSALFFADVKYVIESQIIKKIIKFIPFKSIRDRIQSNFSSLLSFMNDSLESSLILPAK